MHSTLLSNRAAHRMCCLLLIIIIIMPYNRRLDRMTTAYCEQICRDHEKQKRKQVPLHRNGYEDCFRTEHYDLPAAAVTCSDGSYKASGMVMYIRNSMCH